MTDSTEMEALKASFRGALSTTDGLLELKDRVLALDPSGDIAPADLEELAAATLAHAIAAQALRGLIETMRARRSVTA